MFLFIYNKKIIYLISVCLAFAAILFLIVFILDTNHLFHEHFYEFLLVLLVCLSFPANVLLSGTGIFVFLTFCVLIFILSALIFQEITFVFSIPLLIFTQLLAKHQFESFLREKRNLFLEYEKINEKLNDVKTKYESFLLKKNSLKNEINRFLNLRDYILKINLSLSLEQLYEKILNFTNIAIPNGDIYSLAILDNKEKLTIPNFIVREGAKNIILRPDKKDIVNEWLINFRSPLRIVNIQEDFRFQLHDKDSLLYPMSKSIIASPLMSDNKIMGVIRIESVKVKQFNQNDFRLLVIISNITALSLKNAELFKETQKLSITDGLTGLYLPHYMFDILNDFINSYNENNQEGTFALLMMDLDYFKNINDTFGHVVGDNVLIHVAKVLKKYSSKKSFPIRYGGEEFAIFIPNTSVTDVVNLAEKVRKEIFEKKITVRRQNIKVSISIGISFFPEDSKDARTIVQKADDRLYIAKKRGRNQVVVGS